MAYKLGNVKPWVSAAANSFGSKYGIKTIGGWRSHGSVVNSDHPRGLALDFMINNIPNGKSIGDALAADLVANAKQWNVTYVIWYRRIWTPARGWHAYSGPVPHTDHVHASFGNKPGSGGASVTPVQNVSNPLIPESIANAASVLGDGATWRKVAFFIVGAILVIVGIGMLMSQAALSGVNSAAKSVTRIRKVAQ